MLCSIRALNFTWWPSLRSSMVKRFRELWSLQADQRFDTCGSYVFSVGFSISQFLLHVQFSQFQFPCSSFVFPGSPFVFPIPAAPSSNFRRLYFQASPFVIPLSRSILPILATYSSNVSLIDFLEIANITNRHINKIKKRSPENRLEPSDEFCSKSCKRTRSSRTHDVDIYFPISRISRFESKRIWECVSQHSRMTTRSFLVFLYNNSHIQ